MQPLPGFLPLYGDALPLDPSHQVVRKPGAPGEACVETYQGPQISIPAELLANNQHQLASHVSEAF